MPSRPMFPHSPHFLFLSSTRSHDGYFPEVDQLVRSISFCRVKQLYFPFSAHFTNSFPAISPDDCPPYIPSNIKDSSPVPQLSPEDANSSLPCYGYPDPYEHMRNPRFTSVKVRRTACAHEAILHAPSWSLRRRDSARRLTAHMHLSLGLLLVATLCLRANSPEGNCMCSIDSLLLPLRPSLLFPLLVPRGCSPAFPIPSHSPLPPPLPPLPPRSITSGGS